MLPCCSFVSILLKTDFMKYLAKEKQNDMIDAFNLISRYLDELLNIIHIYFDQTVHRIYSAELPLNKANFATY